MFTNDAKNKESIDDHLTNDNNKEENEEDNDDDDEEDNDSPSGNSSEFSEETDDEREEITSLEEAVDVHDVAMLLLRKLISDNGNKELIRILSELESHQGHIEIGKGYNLDEYLQDFLGDKDE